MHINSTETTHQVCAEGNGAPIQEGDLCHPGAKSHWCATQEYQAIGACKQPPAVHAPGTHGHGCALPRQVGRLHHRPANHPGVANSPSILVIYPKCDERAWNEYDTRGNTQGTVFLEHTVGPRICTNVYEHNGKQERNANKRTCYTPGTTKSCPQKQLCAKAAMGRTMHQT